MSILNFLTKGIVSYAEHLKQMDDIKAEYDLKIALLKAKKR
jgi:hypothetical protein